MAKENFALDALINNSPTATMVIDAQLHICYTNAAAIQLLHTPSDELNQMSLNQLNQSREALQVLADHAYQAHQLAQPNTCHLSLFSGDGLHHYSVTFIPINAHIALFFQDQSALVIAENNLKNHATHDTLTGLFNRRQLFTMGSQDIARAKRYHTPFTVLMISIANIRDINQTYGYVMGDHALISVARAIQESLRESDYVGRVDNKSFALCLIDATLAQTYHVEQRLLAVLAAQKVRIADGVIPIQVATGMAEFQREDDKLFDDLLLRAEQKVHACEQAWLDTHK